MTQANQLSKREKEVVELLLQGKSNKQIALALGISDRTVEFHLKNVYAKLQVSSRIEAVLKLGKSTVDRMRENTDNGGKPISQIRWATSFRDTVSIIGKESEMKKRWLYYFLAGLIFGAGYWHYLGATARFFNAISVGLENTIGETWLLLPVALLVYFGVWLIPATLPAVYEFHHSKTLRLSVLAVIAMWVSAVLGYYVNYIVLLAFFGLPHMEYLIVFGQRTSTFWQDWGEIFPKLILFNFLKWTAASVIGSGLVGLITSSLYSSFAKKSNKILPA